MRGAALIGQGLDVSIQVQTDPDEAASAQCFEAEVFHADARQDPARVQVSIEPTQTPQTVNVRIQSSVAVDEPVVTVYLRAGCAQKTSRRYVLLADVLSEPAAPAVVRAPQAPLVVPATTAAAPSSGSPGAGGAAGASAGRLAATPAVRSKPVSRPVAKRTAPAEPARKPVAAKAVAPSAEPAGAAEKLVAGRNAGQSRLKLDPLEVLSERVATLESSTANAPVEQAAREARDAQRLQALESSVKNLLAVATRNEVSLADLRMRLQQTEADRYANPLVYGLASLLLVALAGLAFLLGRRGGAGDGTGNWWSGATNAQDGAGSADAGDAPVTRRSSFASMSSPTPLSDPDSLPAPVQAQEQTRRSGPASKPAPITQVDVSLVEMSESTFDRLMQTGSSHSAVRKAPAAEQGLASAEPARRLISSDDLFDIRQQAEFFVSLGQTDQAVRILENRISESGESSPLAYLDLLKIFHSLGLKADFRQVREDFNLLFNARVPEFAGFDNEGRDLASYPDIVDGLTAVWGTPELLPTVEALLFKGPSTSHRDALDLAAFRDLLLLHAVAQSAQVLPDRLFVPAASTLPRSPYGSAVRSAAPPPSALAAPLADDADLDLSLPVLPGVDEIDIDLSESGLVEPAPDAVQPARASPTPAAAKAGADIGNLIDFDLPVLPGAAPGPGHK